MVTLQLTDEGVSYLEQLQLRNHENYQSWDHGMIIYIDEGHLENVTWEEIRTKVGTEGSRIIRRLFEAGYIEQVEG